MASRFPTNSRDNALERVVVNANALPHVVLNTVVRCNRHNGDRLQPEQFASAIKHANHRAEIESNRAHGKPRSTQNTVLTTFQIRSDPGQACLVCQHDDYGCLTWRNALPYAIFLHCTKIQAATPLCVWRSLGGTGTRPRPLPCNFSSSPGRHAAGA
ncbi:hypothetical protein PSAC2689_60004 [Paraburkholderia sacchari]